MRPPCHAMRPPCHAKNAPLVLHDHLAQPQLLQGAPEIVGVAHLGDLELARRRAFGLQPLLRRDVGAGRRRRLVLDRVEELVDLLDLIWFGLDFSIALILFSVHACVCFALMHAASRAVDSLFAASTNRTEHCTAWTAPHRTAPSLDCAPHCAPCRPRRRRRRPSPSAASGRSTSSPATASR